MKRTKYVMTVVGALLVVSAMASVAPVLADGPTGLVGQDATLAASSGAPIAEASPAIGSPWLTGEAARLAASSGAPVIGVAPIAHLGDPNLRDTGPEASSGVPIGVSETAAHRAALKIEATHLAASSGAPGAEQATGSAKVQVEQPAEPAERAGERSAPMGYGQLILAAVAGAVILIGGLLRLRRHRRASET